MSPADSSPKTENRVRQERTARGLTQQALADLCGLTRQAVCAVEAGHYVPSTTVALCMGRALGRRVEELFLLPDENPERDVALVGATLRNSRQVAVAQVRDRLVAHPLSGSRFMREGFAPADGLVDPKSNRVRLLVSAERVEQTALLLGCDPSLGILAAHVARRAAEAALHWLPASSRSALAAVANGEGHLAGSHMPASSGAESNLSHARKALARTGGMIVNYAAWEQGLMVAKGNPKRICSVRDLAKRGVRMINRDPGSGSRRLLDDALGVAGIPPSKIAGYKDLAAGHFEVARSVAGGAADAGIGLRAIASTCGLDFVALAEVRFDLIIPRDLAGHPAIMVALDVLQSAGLRRELEAIPGYSARYTGSVLAEFPAAA